MKRIATLTLIALLASNSASAQKPEVPMDAIVAALRHVRPLLPAQGNVVLEAESFNSPALRNAAASSLALQLRERSGLLDCTPGGNCRFINAVGSLKLHGARASGEMVLATIEVRTQYVLPQETSVHSEVYEVAVQPTAGGGWKVAGSRKIIE